MICDPFETPRPDDQEVSGPDSDTTWDGRRGGISGPVGPSPKLVRFRRDRDSGGSAAVSADDEGLQRGTEGHGGF
jgi:hypothetical protein